MGTEAQTMQVKALPRWFLPLVFCFFGFFFAKGIEAKREICGLG